MGRKNSNSQIIGLALSLGGMVCIFVVGGAYLGARLDKRFNTQPRLTLLFLGFGLFLSFYNFYKLIKD